MRAIIVGAGNAGSNLAAKLCEEKHDVVIIDRRQDVLNKLETRLDVMTVRGHGGSPAVLDEAGLQRTDLVAAVTSNDDVNIMACYQAWRAGVPYRVARVSDSAYTGKYDFFELANLGVDRAVNPRTECAREILDKIRLPGAREVIPLLRGKVLAAGLPVDEESPLLNSTLCDFPRPDLLEFTRFIAVMRDGQLLIPHGETKILQDDEVYVVAPYGQMCDFVDWACPSQPEINRIIISGGNGLGVEVAKILEKQKLPVVLIEEDEALANACSARLNKTTVLHSNPLTSETMQEAELNGTSAYIATMNNDQNNIISCLLARKNGASFTLAQLTDPEYVLIINSLSNLDRAVSTHLSLINAILRFIRARRVESVALMHSLPGELLEVRLSKNSSWTGKKIQAINIPDGAVIATILRDNEVCAPTGDQQLRTDDSLIIFSTPKGIRKLNAILQK
ncbi:MAG: Trk system potassium transporter TrkA [Verrucomicrobiota bacterium]